VGRIMIPLVGGGSPAAKRRSSVGGMKQVVFVCSLKVMSHSVREREVGGLTEGKGDGGAVWGIKEK